MTFMWYNVGNGQNCLLAYRFPYLRGNSKWFLVASVPAVTTPSDRPKQTSQEPLLLAWVLPVTLTAGRQQDPEEVSAVLTAERRTPLPLLRKVSHHLSS